MRSYIIFSIFSISIVNLFNSTFWKITEIEILFQFFYFFFIFFGKFWVVKIDIQYIIIALTNILICNRNMYCFMMSIRSVFKIIIINNPRPFNMYFLIFIRKLSFWIFWLLLLYLQFFVFFQLLH